MPDKSKEGGENSPSTAAPDGSEVRPAPTEEKADGGAVGRVRLVQRAEKRKPEKRRRQQAAASGKTTPETEKEKKRKEKARRDLSTRRGRAAAGGGQERTQRASMIASVLSAGAGRSWESEKGERRAGVEPKRQRHRKRDVGTGPGEARGDSDRPVQSRWWWPGTHATATQAAQDAGTALAGWRH